MNAEHTQEPWFSDKNGNIWRRDPQELYQNGGPVAGDKPLAICHRGWYGDDKQGFPVEANADRIVACVNACAGIEDPAELRRKYDEVCATRDELLEAARKARNYILEFGNEKNMAPTVADIEIAIANATKGTK